MAHQAHQPHRQSVSGGYKQEPVDDHHHSHQAQQGPPPTHHLQQRPSSIVHQHHQHAPPPQSQHSNAYPSPHGLPQYPQSVPGSGGQHPQQDLPYYPAHPSSYSNTSASGAYSSAEAPEIMAAAQLTRPYPPISYHTPQSNSPASVASPSVHDHPQRMYGAPSSQLQQNPMYYTGPQQQYPPIPQSGPSPYAQHPQQQQPQQQQHHQAMTSQPNLLMSQNAGQHGMHQQNQHQQQGMTGSPRPKMEPQVPQIQRPAPTPLGPPQHQATTPQMNQNNVSNPGGVNPNAAPGPIPATTPLVVRQDNNGVQWIAFEYSRDRVKMEYTIRCDVESVHVDNLSPEFKQENCVYPRACCSKEQYRGNRLVYETECNTVGWALAELNPCLRGKRGLIQRAVDSWRNSNQDPRLRSRRVRRQAKISSRKAVQTGTHTPHMASPGQTGMPPSGNMAPGGNTGNMGKPGMGSGMSGQMHHHHAHPDGTQGGEEVGDDEYIDEQSHHHHQAPNPNASTSSTTSGPHNDSASTVTGAHPSDVRQSHIYHPYSGSTSYPPPPQSSASLPPSMHAPLPHHSHHPIAASHSSHTRSKSQERSAMLSSLFTDVPEAKKRKFILVEDPCKGGRVRVRVTLDTVDTEAIPDSFRRSNSVFPRSWFALEMQSPRPSVSYLGGDLEGLWEGDISDSEIDGKLEENDGGEEVDGGRGKRSRGFGGGRGRMGLGISAGKERDRNQTKVMVPVPLANGGEAEIANPKLRRWMRRKEVKLNDLGYRMTWHQSRVFADRTVFLQKALDSYRNKVSKAIEDTGKDVPATAPHFETRAGKRRWTERSSRRMKGGVGEAGDD